MEKRILFRLLSGLHSSIMTQIANEYRFDDGHWGPNTKMFVNAVGMHPDRLTNMYFAYVFMLRAIGKARPFLMAYEYDTGNAEDDALTRALINELTNAEHGEGTKLGELPGALRDITVPMCLRGFDENSLFGGIEGGSGSPLEVSADGEAVDGIVLKQEFMHKFHNISRIMDCVGCEKCKLWGKLETLGLGTALKIMFFSGDEEGKRELNALSRNELIALVNTAAQLAKSVGSVPGWRWLEVKQKGKDVATRVATWITALVAIVVASHFLMGRFSRRRGTASRDQGVPGANSEAVRDGVNGIGDGPGRGSSKDAAQSMGLKKGA